MSAGPTSRRICLVTTGQPATSPRVVKEADALVDAGFEVDVLATFWVDWAVAADEELAASRRWSYRLLDWRRATAPWLFWKSRLRHRASTWASRWPLIGGRCLGAAAGRTTPELSRAAAARPADLYIAHTLGALPAARYAARRHRARLGFDAEDFHSGQTAAGALRDLAEHVERRYLPTCDYITAASPGIAEAYRALCPSSPPIRVLLNVFPLSQRPVAPRATAPDGDVSLYWFSQTIGPDRGLEDVVRAMGVVGRRDVVLHLRGKWWPGYERQLRALAAASGVAADRIVAHPPAAPAEMARLASCHDIGLAVEPPVTPNNDLLLSNKTFTYLLGGLAVLATRTRGQRWLLDRIPDAAASYDSGHVSELAETLRRWLDDRGALAAARLASWHHGSTHYNWDREQANFLDVIDRTMAQGQAERPFSAAARIEPDGDARGMGALP